MRDMPDYDDLLEDYRGEDFEVIITARRPGGELVQLATVPSARISIVEAFDVLYPGVGVRQFRITTLGGYSIYHPSVVQETKRIDDDG